MPGTATNPVRLTETRYGQLKHFEFDDPIGRSLEVYGEWAQAEIDFLATLVSEGDVVVDVGANVGTHTVAFAALVGEAGHVVAIEPQPGVFALLQANLAANGLAQVEALGIAIADHAGRAHLTVPDYAHRHNSGTAALVPEGAAGTVAVESRRLDDLGLTRCRLLKMDIEGWEDRALLGATTLLETCRPLIYAECNSIEAGWHLLQAAGPKYAAFLHAPPAFNPENHRRATDNIFGVAQETNLLLVPREELAALKGKLEDVPHLDPVTTLDELSHAFLRAARYGEKVASAERSVALARRLQQVEQELFSYRAQAAGAPTKAPVQVTAPATRKLTRPVHVLVPVYNGFDDFQRLVDSLFYTHPTPDPLLKFVFIDDGSPDPRVATFLEDARFERPDVVRLRNLKNRGFIGTINRGLEAYCLNEDGTDVIILNTDTLLFGNVFAIMQDVAYRMPNVASVTPWSNNATIASLFNWPHGADLFKLMEPEDVARAVEAAAVSTPLTDAPTGVGFCMYMTRAATLAVGGFDPAYGKGYGEENSWCQHAVKRGFVNLMCTEAFVYHHGSVSFGDDTKRHQLERNMKLLGEAHPNYHRDVADYVQADPLRGARTQVLWSLRRHYKQALGLRTVLYALHTDPAYFGGGTEKHVMALTEHMLSDGRHEVMHVYPDAVHGQFLLRVYFPRAASDTEDLPLLVARFNEEELYELLRAVAPEVDLLHVHHFLDWPRWLARSLSLFAHAQRLLTLHDYYAVCPSIRLLGKHGFCDLPTSLSTCQKCLREVHHVADSRMDEWRTVNAQMLSSFDQVLVPSEAARRVLMRGFGVVASPAEGSLATRAATAIKATPNFILDLPEQLPTLRPGPAAAKPRVVFLGAYSEPKGARLVELTAGEMQSRGWLVEVWGTLGQDLPLGVTHRSYTNSAELRALGEKFPVDVVLLPATWPETFSFTTFEAALDLRAPVVVGPYGNPPEVVRRFGIGVVLPALTPEAFLAAVGECLGRRAELVQKIPAFERHARQLTVENYVRRVYAPPATPDTSARPALRELPLPAGGVRREREGRNHRDEPLRHRLIDQTNVYIKTRVPRIHATGKSMGKWVLQKVRG